MRERADCTKKAITKYRHSQNSGNLKDLSYPIGGARNVISNASSNCGTLLGKDSLAKFDAVAGNIEFDCDIGVHLEGRGGGVREGRLSDIPSNYPVIDVPNNQVYLSPKGRAFNTCTRGGQPYHSLQSTFDKFGFTQSQYAF